MKQIEIIKDNGVLCGLADAFCAIENAMKSKPNGHYVLKIEKEKKQRSLDQNALMWMWYACIERETGTPKQDIHDFCCKEFNYRTSIINGREEVIHGGTSKLTTVAMTNFLQKVQAWAATEFGIRLPEPSDLYFTEFENYYKQFT